MNAFFASIATESNSFSSIPTSHAAFAPGRCRGEAVYEDQGYFGPMARFLREAVTLTGGRLFLGPFAFAQPAAPTVQSVYEDLREELLDDLRAAGGVDIVVLLLHGAMIAQETWDCEGDILARVRELVGPDVPVGVVLDPHAHLTDEMVRNATLLSFQKEYPHTDGLDRLRDLWRLLVQVRAGRVKPVAAVHDCRMVSFWPTQVQPMRGFVDRMLELERRPGVLSVSFVHGFPWGDTPATGARMLVYADDDAELAHGLAASLGREIWDARETTVMAMASVDEALERVMAHEGRPLVLADMADNAGGGAPADSTFILRAALDRGAQGVGFAVLFDPVAVGLCLEAGVGAALNLRVGGKLGPASGDPVDLSVTVMGVDRAAWQSGLRGGVNPLGAAVWVRGAGLDLILSSERVQCFHPTAFSNLGLDPTSLRALVVKSTNHFRAGFDPIAGEVIYVDTPGAIRADFAAIPYRIFKAPYWPRSERP